MVCGRSMVELALLKRHTTLDGKIDVEAQYIRNFGKYLKHFQEDLKSLFSLLTHRGGSRQAMRNGGCQHCTCVYLLSCPSLSDARKQGMDN